MNTKFNQIMNSQAEKIANICKDGMTIREIMDKLVMPQAAPSIRADARSEISWAIQYNFIKTAGVKDNEWIYKAA